jgi:hypothetical protein
MTPSCWQGWPDRREDHLQQAALVEHKFGSVDRVELVRLWRYELRQEREHSGVLSRHVEAVAQLRTVVA